MEKEDNASFWRRIMGDSDDSDSDFEGFDQCELEKVENDAESDIDVDWREVEHALDAESDDSSSSDDEVVDAVPGRGMWSERLTNVTVEPFVEDIGPKHDLPVDATALDYFMLLIPDSYFDTLADETNRYAEQKQEEKGRPDPVWHPVTSADMKLYIAIGVMMGIVRLPRQKLYWSEDDRLNQPTISKLMSRSRHDKISQYLHLNDRTKQPARGEEGFDPLYKVRPLIDIVSQSFSEHYLPGREVSVDEAMIKYNGRLFFKQYIPSKPTPWGIKIWCCADPRNGYLLDFEVYTGKTNYTTAGGLGHHVVMNVAKRYLEKHYFVFFDNFFTSIALMQDLHLHKTYGCGTIRTNRKGWPKDLVFNQQTKKDKRLKKGETRMQQQGNMVATAWRDKRTVSVLSTGLQPEMGSASRRTPRGERVEKAIPGPVLTYNKYMGGVNAFDQHRCYYTVGRQSRKWWRYLFWFLLEGTIVNAFILFKLSTTPSKRPACQHDPLQFRLGLYDELIKGNVFHQAPEAESYILPGKGCV